MGDIDIGLRTVSQLLPAELAAPFVPASERLETGELPEALIRETQLSRRELRLDKVLAVRVDGHERLLHVEFQTERDPDMGLRVLEYGSAVLNQIRLAKQPYVPLKPVVVLLEGPDELEPGTVSQRFGWPLDDDADELEDAPGLVVRYQLEPVYQRTLAELRARGVLWWVFAPLARDVTQEDFDALLRELRARVKDRQVLAELAATTRVIAERSKKVLGLGERVAGILGEEIIMQSEFLRTMRDKAREEARAETRREDIMRFAARVVDAERLEALRQIEDLDELERQVMDALDRRLAETPDN